MLVFDEVQCGVARTGALYAYQHYGVDAGHHGVGQGHRRRLPDGRLPRDRESGGGDGDRHPRLDLSAATRWRWRRGRRCSTSSPTTSSSPQVRQKGERLRSALEQMIPNHDHLFESVRGVGLMLGVRMKTDSRAFVNYLRTKGLLTVAAGDNVMRVLPPLTIEEEHIREFVDTLSAAAAEYEVPAAAA